MGKICKDPSHSKLYSYNSKTQILRSSCLECRRSRERKLDYTPADIRNRKKQRDNPHNRIKSYVRTQTDRLISSGRVYFFDICELCVQPGILEIHHLSYSNPYHFICICRECHAYLHRHDEGYWIAKGGEKCDELFSLFRTPDRGWNQSGKEQRVQIAVLRKHKMRSVRYQGND